METVFNFLMELKNNFGWTFSFCVLFLILAFTIFWRKIVDIMFALIHKVIHKEFFKFNKKGLLRHPLFMKFQYLRNQRLKFLKCQCPLRKYIFNDLMNIRLNSMEWTLKNLINDEDIEKYQESEFQLKLSGTMYDMFLRWEDDAAKKGIPKIVVSKFVAAVSDIRDGIISYIQNSTNSYSNFKNNYAKIYAILDIISGFEELIIIRLESELDSMNGEISECEYNGVKCKHCQVCQSVKNSRSKK